MPGTPVMAESKARVSGHFGEWLQGRYGRDGPVALITLPCQPLAVTVTLRPGDRLHLEFGGPPFVTTAHIRRLLELLDLPQGGTFTISADMPPGGGAGLSTATLVALARAAGARAAQIAAACVAVEGASDPLMIDAPERRLWASRSAQTLMPLPPIPDFDIIGGFWGNGINTDPHDVDFNDISDLIEQWIPAALAQNRSALARIATQSAQRTTLLRGPYCDPTPDLARELGALGHIRAHTGSARGLIFAPGTIPGNGSAALHAAGFQHIISFRTGGN